MYKILPGGHATAEVKRSAIRDKAAAVILGVIRVIIGVVDVGVVRWEVQMHSGRGGGGT